MRCPECGTETGQATTACVVCGAPTQPSPSAPDSDADGAMLAAWVEGRSFSTTRLRPGYEMEEVDAFGDAIRDTFLGIREPPLTPEEIRLKQFSTVRLRSGYDEEEVDAFLDEAELRLAGQAGAWAVQIRCLECGAENPEETGACARCGAPTRYQPWAPDPAVAQSAGHGGPSQQLLSTVVVVIALVIVGGIFAGSIIHSKYSASFVPPTGQLTVYQLKTGDCLQDSGLVNFNQANGLFTAARCTQPHTSEVFFAGNVWPRSLAYPGDQAIYDDGYVRCDTAFSAYDGIGSWSSAFTVVPSTPDQSTWSDGDRWLVCFATEFGSVDYSIRGSGQ
jgi:DivIVA domain-containing protein